MGIILCGGAADQKYSVPEIFTYIHSTQSNRLKTARYLLKEANKKRKHTATSLGPVPTTPSGPGSPNARRVETRLNSVLAFTRAPLSTDRDHAERGILPSIAPVTPLAPPP